MAHKTKASHRGQGSIDLRGKTWYLRAYDKGKQFRFNLGSLDELPTREDAEAAARYVTESGPQTVAALIQQRHSGGVRRTKFTPQWFTQKLKEQGHRCAICQRAPRLVCADHDHETGKLRGLLCSTCNSGIGMFKDDIALLRGAIAYLEFYGL